MFEKIYNKLKLLDCFEVLIPINISNFVNHLTGITEIGSTGLFSASMSIFSSNDFIYRGQVNLDNFQIRKRPNFKENTYAVATGSFKEVDGQTFVSINLNGSIKFLNLFFIIVLVQLSITVFDIFTGDFSTDLIEVILIVSFYALFFMFPIYLVRESVKNLKKSLQMEFDKMTFE